MLRAIVGCVLYGALIHITLRYTYTSISIISIAIYIIIMAIGTGAGIWTLKRHGYDSHDNRKIPLIIALNT
jgi:predicted transporter